MKTNLCYHEVVEFWMVNAGFHVCVGELSRLGARVPLPPEENLEIVNALCLFYFFSLFFKLYKFDQ